MRTYDNPGVQGTPGHLGEHSWAFFAMEGAKIHFCPKWLLDSLEEDLRTRGCGAVYECYGRDDVWWDPGGMVMMGRSYQKIKIDGANVSVASIDFALFHEKLKSLQLRKFPDGKEYYKLHGWLHATVLSPEQRVVLLEACEKLRPLAEETAEIEHQRFIQALDNINKDGMKIISARDPKVKIERKEDGKVSIAVGVPVDGPLSGTPSDSKN